MRTVTDADGRRYLLVKRSADASLVRDPCTGEERYVDTDDLTVAEESPLVAAGRSLPEDARAALPVEDDRLLGLVVAVDRRGPVGVRTLLDGYDLCESDLHGALAELQAAGLLAETRVGGERGYRTTEAAADALAAVDRVE